MIYMLLQAKTRGKISAGALPPTEHGYAVFGCEIVLSYENSLAKGLKTRGREVVRNVGCVVAEKSA